MLYRFMVACLTGCALLMSAGAAASTLAGKYNMCFEVERANLGFFENPMGMFWSETHGGWIVWEKGGRIYQMNTEGKETLYATLDNALDARADGGLIDVKFHPNYPEVPFAYVTRTVIDGEQRQLRLERYDMADGAIMTDSAFTMLRINMPTLNNPGGRLLFERADGEATGNLFVAVGDGGSHAIGIAQASNPQTFLGSILRINVDGALPYEVPLDNPFVTLQSGAAEVYAYGVRTPSAMSQDAVSERIWFGDSGLNYGAEINHLNPRVSYGWDCVDVDRMMRANTACTERDALLSQRPALYYGPDKGLQATGGAVYRGRKYRQWYGKYVFADFVSGQVYVADASGNTLNNAYLAYQAGFAPISFAEDQYGELYVVDMQGRILSLHPRACARPQRALTP